MALRNQPYIPLYVQDFMSDEKLLQCSAQSTGVYVRIMCLMHKSDQYGTVRLKEKHKTSDNFCLNFANYFAKVLPYDLPTITASIIELVEEEVLIISGDLMYQKRMVKDNSISEIRAKSGSKGGKNKTSFAVAKSEAKSEQNTESESVFENENRDEDIIVDVIEEKSYSHVYPSFDDFWNLYDRKEDKKDAIKKWEKLNQLEKEYIMSFIPNYKLSLSDLKYQRNPVTFLNKRTWENELPKTTPQNGQSKPSNKPATVEQIIDHFSKQPIVSVKFGDYQHLIKKEDTGDTEQQ